MIHFENTNIFLLLVSILIVTSSDNYLAFM